MLTGPITEQQERKIREVAAQVLRVDYRRALVLARRFREKAATERDPKIASMLRLGSVRWQHRAGVTRQRLQHGIKWMSIGRGSLAVTALCEFADGGHKSVTVFNDQLTWR